MNNWIDFKFKLDLLFKGKIDGFGSDIFHQKVDNCGSTLLIVKSTNGRLFGGYS